LWVPRAATRTAPTVQRRFFLYRVAKLCYTAAMTHVRRSRFYYLAWALCFLWAARWSVAQQDAPSVTDERFFEAYRRGQPITQWPLKKMLHEIPELKGLKPAIDQSQLPIILDRVSANLQRFVANFANTTALETIDETAMAATTRRTARIEQFRYLILARPESGAFTLTEYRTDLKGREESGEGLTPEFIKTTGFVSMALFFGPLEQPWSDFHHLGEHAVDGSPTEVIAFAEHIWPVAVTGHWLVGGGSVPLLVQGVAWIRSSDYQIIKMRTDLLAPIPPLTRMTTKVSYAMNQLEGGPPDFWLPKQVEVIVDIGRFEFTNRHKYADYRLFRVESIIKPD